MFKKMQHWVNKEKLKKNLLNEETGEREQGEEADGGGQADRCRYLTNVAEIGFFRWLRTQILISDFPPKNEISLFEPRLELCLRVPTHA
ncbi:hypothetical protein H6G91_19475 [Nostoc muscorum FACHB-395]|nr:hypothetical protein [Desmonostoc muscorum FACHB-395]